MHDRNFGKNNHYIQNKDIAMYAFIKFQSIWKTSVLGTKFAQETLQGRLLGQMQPENNLY